MPAEISMESGFSVFVDRMRVFLAHHDVPAEFAAGWLARPKQGALAGGSRIVIGPSKPKGSGGQIIPPLGPGIRRTDTQAVRPLAAWEMQLVCYVWATDKTSEEAQVNATFGLMTWAMRAIAYASNGHYTFGATDWKDPETLTQNGRELMLSFAFRSNVLDTPWNLTGPLSPNVKREPAP